MMMHQDAWELCIWTVAATGRDWRSSVQEWSYTREGATQGMCTQSITQDDDARTYTHALHNSLSVIRVSSNARKQGTGGAWAHFCSLESAYLTISIQPSAIHKLSLSYNEPIHWRMHATSTHACNINRAVTWRTPHG
eukprot:174391-Pelagomonas_calceolata.AAC.1